MNKEMLKILPSYRNYPIVEIRAETSGLIAGHFAVYNQWSVDLGGFVETMEPGTFTESIQNDDIYSFFNHDPNKVLGRKGAGTVKVKEDDIGLMFEIDPPDTQYADDLRKSIRRGDVDGGSIMFYVLEDRWGKSANINPQGEVRYISKAQLKEGGPVVMAAYPQTDALARTIFANGFEIKKTKEEPPDPEPRMDTGSDEEMAGRLDGLKRRYEVLKRKHR